MRRPASVMSCGSSSVRRKSPPVPRGIIPSSVRAPAPADRIPSATSEMVPSPPIAITRRAAGAAGLDTHPAPFAASFAAWLVVAGASGLLAYVCLFYAFEHGRLTLAVPIMSSWAVLSAGLSIVLFGERLSAGQLVGAAAVVAGAVVVARQSQSGSTASPVGRGWLPASFGA